MTKTKPHRVTVAPPVRAITFTSADPDQPANPETDPHAAAPKAKAAPEPARDEPEAKPAATRKGK